MCGRYDNLIARDAYKALYRVGRLPASNFPLRYNVASQPVGGLHDRMPVMLLSQDYDRWLDPSADIPEARSLLRPYDPALMQAYAVHRAVNNVKNDDETCIEPIGEPPLT
jgi:SOS response associated peptidase (SRAP)